MYEFTSRVRYSEIGSDAHMKLSAIVARMQDCCVFHSESIGRGPLVWTRDNCGWMILSWQILIHKKPVFAEPVRTETWGYRFRGIEGDRNFLMKDEAGNILAEANSRWIYFDLTAQKPARVPQVEIDGYGTEPALTSFTYSPRRIELPSEGDVRHDPFEIVRTNIDTNHHVNNLQYIDMALAYLPENETVKELRVEYVRQVKLGEMLYPRSWDTDGAFIVSLENADGKPCAIVEFLV